MMARPLILKTHPPVLWERRQPVSGDQTHMSCTELLNQRLIVMLQAIPHTIPYILLTSLGHHLCTMSVHCGLQTGAIKLIEFIYL